MCLIFIFFSNFKEFTLNKCCLTSWQDKATCSKYPGMHGKTKPWFPVHLHKTEIYGRRGFEFDQRYLISFFTPNALQLQIKHAYLIDKPTHPWACRQHEQNIGKQQEIPLFFLLRG